MIEFKGNLSAKSKEYLIEDSFRLTFFIILIVCIPFVAATIALTILDHWSYSLMFIPIALLLFFGSLKPSTKAYKVLFGKNGRIFEGELRWNIIIDQDLISAEGIQRSETRSIDDVKKVVDMGEFYKIYFYFPHKSNLFICQKDLLDNGTIEEFEKLFSAKLIKK